MGKSDLEHKLYAFFSVKRSFQKKEEEFVDKIYCYGFSYKNRIALLPKNMFFIRR